MHTPVRTLPPYLLSLYKITQPCGLRTKVAEGGELSPMQTATGQKHKRVANGMGNLKTNNKLDKKKTGTPNMRS